MKLKRIICRVNQMMVLTGLSLHQLVACCLKLNILLCPCKIGLHHLLISLLYPNICIIHRKVLVLEVEGFIFLKIMSPFFTLVIYVLTIFKMNESYPHAFSFHIRVFLFYLASTHNIK